jgi:hypothetical protein
VVKVNPKDVVSVPLHDKTKLRCCKYESVNVFTEASTAKELSMPVYTENQYRGKDFESVSTISVEPATDYEAWDRDDLARFAAEKGITVSMNEGRFIGKDMLVQAVTIGKLPLDAMSNEDLANLCARRHKFSSATAARKAGRDRMVSALNEA